jgi:hypothetical protein
MSLTAITSTTARPMGEIATRTSSADRRRSHGQVRAAENREWRAAARSEIAALKLVTVR